MSHFSVQITEKGPILWAYVGVSAHRHKALRDAGQPVPNHRVANILVDTGATSTCIDQSVINQLSIQPTGVGFINTPSSGDTPHMVNVYDISMTITGADGTSPHKISTLRVNESNLHASGIDGLLGRDVLSRCHMTYEGYGSQMYLTFF
ncbi:MAG: hypothetical protein V6Z81_04430 [Parvularculales bacterium]